MLLGNRPEVSLNSRVRVRVRPHALCVLNTWELPQGDKEDCTDYRVLYRIAEIGGGNGASHQFMLFLKYKRLQNETCWLSLKWKLHKLCDANCLSGNSCKRGLGQFID